MHQLTEVEERSWLVSMFQLDDNKPIYLQIAEWLETEIIKERFKEDEKILSQYKLAEMFNINPATAAKGLNVLADEGILYDKRGIGKFVEKSAKKRIKDKRKNETMKHLIQDIALEAINLDIKETELMEMVKTIYLEVKGEQA